MNAKRSGPLAAALAAAAALAWSGCATAPGMSQRRALADPDVFVARDVESRLREDPMMQSAMIRAVASGGRIVLQGTVRDLSEERRAIAIAEGTAGVREVVSRLFVFEGGGPAGPDSWGPSPRTRQTPIR